MVIIDPVVEDARPVVSVGADALATKFDADEIPF